MYFSQLIEALIGEGEKDKALAALDKCIEVMPSKAVPYGTEGLLLARAYYQLGHAEKGEALIDEISERITKNLAWFDRLTPQQMADSWIDISRNNLDPLLLISNIYQQYNKEKYQPLVDDLLERAQFYYIRGITPLGDSIVQELTNVSIRGFYGSGSDSISQKMNEQNVQKALELMQQFNPKLLEQYGMSK
jgi:tetratricopeptide (TPR) repeat protein